MSYTVTQIGDDTLALSGIIDFSTAPAVLADVSARLESGNITVLDLAGIESANSAGLGLLIEWKRLALMQGTALSISNMPEKLLRLADICQVTDQLSLEPANSALPE